MRLCSRRETFEQLMNRGDIDHALTVFGPEFKVLAQATISAKPSKGTLDDPAPGNNFKTLLVIAAQGNVHHDFLEFLASPVHKLPSVATIRPDTFQTFEQHFGQLLNQ